MAGAQLRRALLGGADLTKADLTNADLQEAYLPQTNLEAANLWGADLRAAHLAGAKGVTNEQLEQQADSLEGATMPNGQKYEEWLKDKEGR